MSAVFSRQSDQAVGVNVGDSRIYGITSAHKLVQLSKDDTLAGYLGQSAPNDERRHQIVQYIGMGESLEPHIIPIHVNEFNAILITSDGVHNSPSEALDQSVASAHSNIDLIQKLIGLKRGGLPTIVAWYACSLACLDYDVLEHPSFDDYARGVMASDHAPDFIKEDEELRSLFPPRTLTGLGPALVWEPPALHAETMARFRRSLARAAS